MTVETTKIAITEIVNSPVCVSPDDGEQIFERLVNALETSNQVEISFKGVEDLTASFLNRAIGQLYGKFSERELKAKLRVLDANQDDLALIKRCVECAKEYFRNSFLDIF